VKPKPNQFTVTLGLTKYALRAALRNRSGVFFSLVFPIIFIAIFGAISNGSSAAKLGVANSFNTSSPVYAAIQAVTKEKDSPLTLQSGSEADLESQLSKGKIDAVLEPGPSGLAIVNGHQVPSQEVFLATSPSSLSNGEAIEGILAGVINQINLRLAGVTTPPISLATKNVSGHATNYIDYVLPGQIGFSLIGVATFGVAFPFLTLRKTLVLKRIFATGVKPLSFIISQGISRSVQAVFQVAILVGFGVKFFHFDLAHGATTFIEMLVLGFFGVIAFLGFGLLFSNIAKDEQTLPTVLNLFQLPQILLAGVFFSTDILPSWLQKIGNNLPLAYLNTAMRNIANNGDGFGSRDVWPYLLGLLAWSALAYFFAARTFKSE
jgi:ABC-2 type transport system permease protein